MYLFVPYFILETAKFSMYRVPEFVLPVVRVFRELVGPGSPEEGAVLEGAGLKGAGLEGAGLEGAVLDLRKVTLG